MTAGDRIEMKELCEVHDSIDHVIEFLKDGGSLNPDDEEELEMLEELQAILIFRLNELVSPVPELFEPLPKIRNRHVTINGLQDAECYCFFRFRKQQLNFLKIGLQFPEEMTVEGNHFSGEEILLAGLFRIAAPNRFGDAGWVQLFGWDQPRCSHAFDLFLNFMIPRWMYLVEDNMEFWLPKLFIFARKIKEKLSLLGVEYPDPSEENGFNVFGFIDCTNLRTCRPGGGPVVDGPNSTRNDQNLQRAFYNGWKKQHGYKWQTIDLPNGMNFHVWGPVSLRHNDLECWYNSDMAANLLQLQLGQPKQVIELIN